MSLESLMALLTYLLIFVSLIAIYSFISRRVDKKAMEKHVSIQRKMLIKKTLKICLIVALVFVSLSIWGIETQSFLIFISGILALIAIGFFAVWSILSNVLAGMILFFTGTIKMGDEILIIPENIKGEVIDINSVFTVLTNKKGEIINIPNNLIFQRIVKKIPPKKI